jgi:sodium-dependent dicarboxylate transporter 2/3/5
MAYKKYSLYFVLVFLVFIQCYFNPFNIALDKLYVSSIGICMIVAWIIELLPMAITALVPLIIFPLLGIQTIQQVSISYADPIIFLFMGGFFLAIAIEKWNLHKRIALNILAVSGSNGNHILLGIMLSTFFISMWLSNSATSMMMFPIALSIIKIMEQNNAPKKIAPLATAIMLSIAYASNLGGLATIIGTPPNTAIVGYLKNEMQIEISFINWFAICFPIAIVLIILLYLLFTKVLFRNDIKPQAATTAYIKSELTLLGKMNVAEQRVTIVFIITALLWIVGSLLNSLTGLQLNDTIVALLAAFFLFLIPSGVPNKANEIDVMQEEQSNNNLLVWKDTVKMEWGILLMFGGGLALAKAMEKTGIMSSIGQGIAMQQHQHLFVVILIISTISVFLSEVMSNIAQVIVMAPIVSAIAVAMHIAPVYLCIPMALAASCAGMLPMGTPPNAIAFSSNKIKLFQMLKAGFLLNLISILVISIFSYLLLGYII